MNELNLSNQNSYTGTGSRDQLKSFALDVIKLTAADFLARTSYNVITTFREWCFNNIHNLINSSQQIQYHYNDLINSVYYIAMHYYNFRGTIV